MKTKVEIIPAILPKDWNELEEKILLVKDSVKTVQIDVCDGQFTPDPTWPYRKTDDSFQKLLTEELGLPGWEKLNFEIDLMANRPEEVVDDWVQVGANRIIIHVEARGDVAKAIESLKDRVEICVAMNIETPISAVAPYIESIQGIQLMGIDNVGFQHQPFDAKVIEKIKEMRLAYPDMPISVDGGVSLENSRILVEAGATRLVVGSAIFDSDNYLEAIQQFKAVGRQ